MTKNIIVRGFSGGKDNLAAEKVFLDWKIAGSVLDHQKIVDGMIRIYMIKSTINFEIDGDKCMWKPDEYEGAISDALNVSLGESVKLEVEYQSQSVQRYLLKCLTRVPTWSFESVGE